ASVLPAGLRLHAHAGSGIVRGWVADALTLEDAQAMLKELHAALGDGPGNVVLPRCPPEWKRALPVWGRPRGDADLMRSVKAALPRGGWFNPGRFIDGI